MRRLLLAGMVLFTGCGDDSSGPDGETADIEGSWSWSADISNDEVEISCSAVGSALIEQSGEQFSGQITNSTGTCNTPTGSVPFDLNGAIVGGLIEGNAVSFEDNDCEYSGLASGDPVDEVDGDVTCIFSVEGEDLEFTGTWQMSR
jgi:hypothetical protein